MRFTPWRIEKWIYFDRYRSQFTFDPVFCTYTTSTMKCISGLCLFLLHLSVALALEAPRSRPYYGASPRHEATKHEQENLVEIIFENFRDGEATILEEEVRSLLSDFVPAALKAAVKKNDPL